MPGRQSCVAAGWWDYTTLDEKLLADAVEYMMPPIEVVPAIDVAGTLVDREGNALPNVDISGAYGNRRYGFSRTDDHGSFVLRKVPKKIQLEKFMVSTRDERLTGVVETREPLVVRVEK